MLVVAVQKQRHLSELGEQLRVHLHGRLYRWVHRHYRIKCNYAARRHAHRRVNDRFYRAGKDCSININECETNPCAAGSTCVDGIASFSCVCQEGLTGAKCEIDIDDCQVRHR